jgi:hypothetical protein
MKISIGAATSTARAKNLALCFFILFLRLEYTLESKNYQSQHSTYHSDTDSAEPARNANRSRQPQACRSCESPDVALLIQLEYRPGTDETNTCNDALDHSRETCHVHATPGTSQNDDGGAETDQDMRSQSGGLACFFSFDADNSAEQDGSDNTDQYCR